MILGLFKEKLNVNDHKHVINYIISEEAVDIPCHRKRF